MNPSSPIRIALLEPCEAVLARLAALAAEAGLEVVAKAGLAGEAFCAANAGVVVVGLAPPGAVRSALEAAPRAAVVGVGGDEPAALRALEEGAHAILPEAQWNAAELARACREALARHGAEEALQARCRELERCLEERTRPLAEAGEPGETLSGMIRHERLHALERMASGIAHDFNNALSPILAHTEWLLFKPHALADRERVAQTLLKVRGCAEQCAQTVKRLREFSRGRDPVMQLEPLDLAVVLTEAIHWTRPAWRDQARARGVSIKVESDLPAGLPVCGAKAELRELFSNLILNAIDAMPRGGAIRVRAFWRGGRACASVGDDGIGMTEEVGARCMEPFFTTKNAEGSGLGLGVVYGIAQRHEVEIDIESTPGAGTEVTVRFPMGDTEAAGGAPEGLLRGLRILVAEDEPMIREVIGLYLAEDGHQVEMAADGAEALRRLQRAGYDLIVTDRSMPALSGDAVAAQARVLQPSARVLLLTGFADAAHAHADAVVPKPFTLQTLREGIAAAMAGPQTAARELP